ncbi:MAG: hypothetical protein AAF640_11005 [Pseudomonadota bacterium]
MHVSSSRRRAIAGMSGTLLLPLRARTAAVHVREDSTFADGVARADYIAVSTVLSTDYSVSVLDRAVIERAHGQLNYRDRS